MIQQIIFTLRPRSRGFHLITDEVISKLPELPQTGILNLFIQHTSAGLSINENCDPDVRSDLEKILCNSGKLSLVPYTKGFGRITHF